MHVIRRAGVVVGAFVEAALVLWLISGFLPAGVPVLVLAAVLGGAIYRDIQRREEENLR